MALAQVLEKATSLTKPPTVYDQGYLLGFRGLLVIESFLWIFLQTFVPSTVAASANPSGRFYEEMIRKTLSVLFWNDSFLYCSIIFLSARSIAIPFIKNPSKERVARSVLCRGVTLWFPVACALAFAKGAMTQAELESLYNFKTRTNNYSMQIPYFLPNTLAYFNSVFNVFWTTHNYAIQAGSTAFPSQTLWLVTAVYMQSYTVYMTMVIIPYTRKKWRMQGAFFFVLTAWWCDSWAWYTITGLLFCDMVITMDFKAAAQRGIPIDIPIRRLRRADGSPFRLPVWLPAGLLMVGGYVMQFLWHDYRPDLMENEYEYHSGLYYTGGLNYEYETNHTPARGDIYLIIVGFFFLLESYDIVQRIFANKFFVFLGKRSLSKFYSSSG
jgi:hypothetical protein